MTPNIHPPTLDEAGPETTLSEILLTVHKQLSLVGLALFANLHVMHATALTGVAAPKVVTHGGSGPFHANRSRRT